MSQYHLFYVDQPQNRFILDSARLVIGSGEDADIRVDVPGLYMEAIFVGEQLTILESSMPIRVNGQWLHDYPVDVAARQVISVSDTQHLVFTDVTDQEAVVVPHLEVLLSEGENKGIPWKERIPTIARFFAATIGTVVLILIVAMTSATLKKEEPLDIEPQPELQNRPRQDIRMYTEQTLGKSLIAYERFASQLVITSLEVPKTTQEDLTRVIQHYEPEVKVTWKIVRPVELVQRTNEQLKHIKGASSLTAIYAEKEIRITGAVFSLYQASVAQQVQHVSVAPFKLRYTPEIVNVDVKVMALSIGQYQATATIKSHGQILQLAENQQIPSLGAIRLIKHDGIIVSTRHGDVFIPLS